MPLPDIVEIRLSLRSPHVFFLASLCLFAALLEPAATQARERDAPAEEAFREAAALVDEGRFREAVARYETAAAQFERAGRPAELCTTLYNLAVAYHAIGNYKLAFDTLDRAASEAETLGDEKLRSRILGLSGAISVFSRKAEVAGDQLLESIREAERAGDDVALAWLLNDYGIMLAGKGELEPAQGAFSRGKSIARRKGITGLLAKLHINAAMMHLNAAGRLARGGREFGRDASAASDETFRAQLENAWSELEAAAPLVAGLPPSFNHALMLVSIGDAYAAFRNAGPAFRGNFIERAFTAYRHGLDAAEAINNPVALSYASGRLGNLYERRGRLREALEITARAREHAAKAQRPDALYEWEWQIGRILAATGEKTEALEAYRRARQILSGIRHDVAIGFGNRNLGSSFREAVGDLYFEMADLILQLGEAGAPDGELQTVYREARLVIESFKSAELEDYFQDDCVNLALSKREDVEEIAANTAVFYIIPLSERTEILVGIQGRIHRFTSGVARAELNNLAFEFRRWLEADGDPTFISYAQPLYDHLVKPAEKLLRDKEISTLVFVPDGSLRNIPMAALHDGERYLVQRYSVAVTPGLQLMETNRIPRGEAPMLVGALSKGVRGFAPLQSVKGETDAIVNTITPKPIVLFDDEFLKADFTKDVTDEPYQIVHIASHGEFSGDSTKSFVLTYDAKLSLNDLEAIIRPRQFHGAPVELLGLSACRTAAGDDRAALGLAGVAVKSGARSAFASLWYVDDVVSSMIVSSFYRRLAEDTEISKAEALRQAQLAVLGDMRYSHPRAWAPYLIIGNWR